ncbi:endo-1,4-beta-xylanase [Ruminiclostridium herbifermentans]|uniref:Beta-xylanase n=1 Tax=Ruminiclostridium herbifermentans TaxID=2488810 RepID=A0A4V6EPA0_9FIRM|nr:endo-1,4-beta-xylanase [Ruminiclostridium herbifermentans]QNU65476.1 endo-1,4-beta-xylanase [Ruminiclostridium herbifermentans]
MSKKLSLLLVIAIVLTSLLPMSMSDVQAADTLFAEAGDTKKYDFEDGSSQGWEGLVSTVEVVNDTVAANSGSYGLKSSNSSANWQGAMLNITSFPAGKYKIEGYVKLVSAERSALKITHQHTDKGADGDAYDQLTANDNVTSSEWTKLEGTFTLSKIMVASSIKIESADSNNTPDYYLDDVTFTLVSLDNSKPEASSNIKSYEYNFDNGTTQGWSPRGDGVNVAVSAEAATSLPNSIKVTGRSQNWHGASINALGKLDKDVIYTVTAKVKSICASTTPSAISLTMQQKATAGGASTEYKQVASTGSINDSEWHEIKGTYSFTEDMVDQTLYFESSDPYDSFYIDDIYIASPGAGVPNIGFEDKTTQGFTSRLGCNVTVTNADKKAGTYSLLVSDREDEIDGPIIDVSGKMLQGSKYNISTWLKIAPGSEQSGIIVSMAYTKDGDTKYTNLFGSVSNPFVVTESEGWVNLNFDYLMAYDADEVSLYIESRGDTASFYIDDFCVTYIPPSGIQTDIPSLKDVYEKYFEMGASVVPGEYTGSSGDLLKKHFNSMVAGNDNKPESILPNTFLALEDITEANLNLDFSDYIKEYTEANNLKWRWHTLVWHSQTPDWLFTDENGNDLTTTDENGNLVLIEKDPVKQAANKELVLNRLKAYIKLIINRYGEYIDYYDVVNEVIDPAEPDGMRRSKWYVITGKDYIKVAFKTAKDELYAKGYTGKLYINDYNTEQPSKRDFLYNLVQEINKDEPLIDGVGHQCHIGRTSPSVSSIIASIEKFADAGLDNQVTELDVSNYDDSVSDFAKSTANKDVPEEVLLEQGYRYKQLFEGLLDIDKKKDCISSVAIWGISDANTWLSTFPITRLEKPLLFDTNQQAKYAYWGVVLANPEYKEYSANLPILIKNLSTPKGTPKIDGNSELLWESNAPISVQGDNGYIGSFRVRWDENNLYVFAEVTDASTNKSGSIDVFVNDTKTTFERKNSNSNFKTVETEKGYILEAKIPLTSTVVLDEKVSFDIRFVDGNGKMVSWNDITNNQDTSKANIGKLTLSEAVSATEAIKGTPTIDGTKDKIWDNANEISVNKFITGTSGATAVARTMWDENKLYVYAVVTDGSLHKESKDTYQQDSIEIFVDQKNDKTDIYGDDDGQYRINFDNEQSFGSNPGGSALTSAAIVTETGYIVEAAIDLDKIDAKEGTVIGFDLQVNNSDNSNGIRDSVAIWNDISGNSWSSLVKIGVVKLVSTKGSNTDNGSGSGSNSGSGSGTGTTPNDDKIKINGKNDKFAKIISEVIKGKKHTILEIIEDEISKILKDNILTITIDVKNGSNIVEGRFEGVTFKELKTKNAVLQINTENGTYILPASKIDIEKIALALGSDLKDITISIKIAESSDEKIALAEENAKKNKYKLVAKPIEFEITVTNGDKTIDVSKFDSFIERLIAIPDDINPKEISTAVIINTDGSFSHIPTSIVYIDGKYYAKIKSMTNSTYAVIANNKAYSDVEKHWSKDAVNVVTSRLILSGTVGDKFEPNLSINRGEFVDSVVKALGLYRSGAGVDSFIDVTKASAYYDSISIAYEYGLVSGYADNSFKPNSKITRQEALVIVAKAMKLAGIKTDLNENELNNILSSFKDSNKVSSWSKMAIAACIKNNIISGTNTKMIEPQSNITRGEVASIINKILKNSGLI